MLKKILPQKLNNFIMNKKTLILLINSYWYDLKKYYSFSRIKGNNTSIKLISKIISEYHVIEKGLTIPQTRLGFGKKVILSLCDNCERYIYTYGSKDEQLKHAIGVVHEYKQFHDLHNYELDIQILSTIENLKSKVKGLTICSQRKISIKEYYRYSEFPFPEFSNSRSSIRNYNNKNIPIEKIANVLSLVRNTPSACNRQSWRTYIYTKKDAINKILEIQGGNKGFGHLTNKLIVITAELGVFSDLSERNQAFIDGGMYAMNVLYALHYYQIAVCILNCSNSPEKDIKLRSICKIKESEVFIAMLACGTPPDEFMITDSIRHELKFTNTIVD